MSNVTRLDNDGPINRDSGRRDSGDCGRAGGPGWPADRPWPNPPVTSRMGRVARLEEAVAQRAGGAFLPWIGTRDQLISDSIDDRRVLVTHLRAACMAERRRGIARHWTYSKARHDALATLLEREEAEIHAMMEVA